MAYVRKRQQKDRQKDRQKDKTERKTDRKTDIDRQTDDRKKGRQTRQDRKYLTWYYMHRPQTESQNTTNNTGVGPEKRDCNRAVDIVQRTIAVVTEHENGLMHLLSMYATLRARAHNNESKN